MSLNLNDAKTTAEVLTTALPYIQRFVGKLIVVKYGGIFMRPRPFSPNSRSMLSQDRIVTLSPTLYCFIRSSPCV